MNEQLEVLLAEDHESLGKLFTELDGELTNANVIRGIELLDLFWAKLAVHVRAENLHLFPALSNVPNLLLTARDGLPTYEQAQNVLTRLRSDHDFFMKELALAIKAMREMAAREFTSVNEVELLRIRLTVIKGRLDDHNAIEEEEVYVWPSLLFDDRTTAAISERVQHELQNLPPRFAQI